MEVRYVIFSVLDCHLVVVRSLLGVYMRYAPVKIKKWKFVRGFPYSRPIDYGGPSGESVFG